MDILGAPALLVLFGLLAVLAPASARAAMLHAGASSVSITPGRPVALDGQMHTRIAREVQTEVLANALALETRDRAVSVDQAIFVACDLLCVPPTVSARARAVLAERIPEFDVSKLVISATHTHTAPVTVEGTYHIPDEDVMPPAEYVGFLSQRIADAAERSWKARKPAKVGWGMGDAVVAYNRRSMFADGHAEMYGDVSVDAFRGVEGPVDHAVEVLFFWDDGDNLIATATNIGCTSQEVEGLSAVDADFWHPVRQQLKAAYGQSLVVLGWTGAAGDQSPHVRYRAAAEDRMRRLRGLSRLDEIARRIVRAWREAYEGARQEPFSDVPFVHQVTPIALPRRAVTREEYEEAKAAVQAHAAPEDMRIRVWHQEVVDRYEHQIRGDTSPYTMELHTLRLGDVAITTNDFELYAQFGIQVKARSKALHTFVIQLAGPGTYVPTPRAAEGGGYSAIAQSNEVGPEGGQVLADRTVAGINSLWTDE